MISFSKARFCDFSQRATEMEFFENGRWNYMTIASRPHIPFLWWVFLRLGSTSSCGAPLVQKMDHRWLRHRQTQASKAVSLPPGDKINRFWVRWFFFLLANCMHRWKFYLSCIFKSERFVVCAQPHQALTLMWVFYLRL